MANSFNNPKKQARLKQIEQAHLEELFLEAKKLEGLTKFCFAYYDHSQEYSKSVEQFQEKNFLVETVNKLVEFGKHPLIYWRQQFATRKSRIFTEYGDFPVKKSWFKNPTHVPHNIIWARFRLNNLLRLAGFIIPNDEKSKSIYQCLDKNTFYVVFLDDDHKFYDPDK